MEMPQVRSSFSGLAWSVVTWFAAGVGLTFGYRFAMWLLHIVHLA